MNVKLTGSSTKQNINLNWVEKVLPSIPSEINQRRKFLFLHKNSLTLNNLYPLALGIGKTVTTQLTQGPSTAQGGGKVIRSGNQRLAGLFPAQDNAVNSSSWLFNVFKQILLWTTYYRNDPMEYGLNVSRTVSCSRQCGYLVIVAF